MSSQEVVDFMKKKLIEGISPNEAVEALFDACICDDPHNAAGQGADNMTCAYTVLLLSFFIFLRLPCSCISYG